MRNPYRHRTNTRLDSNTGAMPRQTTVECPICQLAGCAIENHGDDATVAPFDLYAVAAGDYDPDERQAEVERKRRFDFRDPSNRMW